LIIRNLEDAQSFADSLELVSRFERATETGNGREMVAAAAGLQTALEDPARRDSLVKTMAACRVPLSALDIVGGWK
jgi:hypothetical protein